MKPRARADPAADPRNAVKKLYAVRRRHRTRWPPVEMVSMDAVQTVLKGMMKEFIDAHGFRSLVPKRKLPLTNDIINCMLGVPEGAKRGALTVVRKSYYWLSMFCLFDVNSETGYIGSSTLRTGYREINGDLVLGQIDSIFRVALHWLINQTSPPAFCTQTSNQLRRRSPADRHRERTCPRASSALPRARRLPAAAVD